MFILEYSMNKNYSAVKNPSNIEMRKCPKWTHNREDTAAEAIAAVSKLINQPNHPSYPAYTSLKYYELCQLQPKFLVPGL